MISNSKSIDISIVIPAKDEQDRLPRFLSKVLDYCHASQRNYEVIVVDDGSRDQTFPLLADVQKNCEGLKVLRFQENRGKGQAVSTGLMSARGNISLFMDADGSTPVEEIESNLHYFDSGYDIVIGSRVLKDSFHSVKVSPSRKLIGKVFNALVHCILFKGIEDTQCGFKMFKKDVIRPLFSRMRLKGFGFDLELLYLAYKMGYRVKEAPVNWSNVDGSKVNLVTDSWKMFLNIFQVRNWHFTPINLKNKAMSEREFEYMFKLEQNHWWFQSKSELVKFYMRKSERKFSTILDAGCGTGLTMMFLKKFGNCFGCDSVLSALNFCRKNKLSNLSQTNLEQIPFKANTFNLITSLDVIEHTENPKKVFSEFCRVLKDEGIIILTVPAFNFLWSQHDDALCHLRRYSRKDLVALANDAGFEVKKIGYLFFTSFLIVTPIRLFRKLFVRKGQSVSDTTTLPPQIVNTMLKWLFKWEIKISSRIPLPFGTTLFCILSKEANSVVPNYEERSTSRVEDVSSKVFV